MKKFWLLLLAGCAMTLSPACTDKEEENGPSSPVECSVPATAEIGSEMTLTGQGFAATAEVALRNSAGNETRLENPEITASGFTGLIPATLTPGAYTVVLYQDGTWELGTVTLTAAAECPVLSITVPDAIRLNQALEIAGAGFSSDMGIVLENTADQSRTELTVALSSAGVTCTIPDDVSAGTYNVILTQDNHAWTIAESVPAAVYKHLVGLTKTVATQYVEEITIDMLAQVIYESGLAPTLEYAQMVASSFISSYQDGETLTEYRFTYDTEGNPTGSTALEPGDETASAWYTFTVNDDKISATNNQAEEGGYDMFSFDWTLVNGRVEQETTVTPKSATQTDPSTKRTNNYTWVYDAQGVWSGVNYTNGSSYLKILSDAGKFQDAVEGDYESAGSIFTYGIDSRKNAIFGVDVAKILYTTQGSIFEDDLFHAICLNVAGQASLELPTNMGIMDYMTGEITTNPELEYTFDNDGYVTKVAWSTSGKDSMFGFDYNEQSSFSFIYE